MGCQVHGRCSDALGNDDPGASELMLVLLHLSEWAPKMNDLFIRIRKSPKDFVKNTGAADVDTWDNVAVPTMESILVSIAMQLLKDLEQV